MSKYQESKYYADPHFLLVVDELDSLHGEYKPTEVGYAYKLGRGKNQTIKSVLTPGNYEKQLLFEATTLEFWPYPGTDPKTTSKYAKLPQPNQNDDPDFLMHVHALDEENGGYISVEVGHGYKLGRGKHQVIKSVLATGLYEKELLMMANAVELKPFVRVIPESLGNPTPIQEPTYRLAAALSR